MTPPASAQRARTASRPRRVSGPAPRTRLSAAAPAIAPGTRQRPHSRPPIKAARAPKTNPGLLGALIGLPEHRLLDRMIRGRVWIGFVAFALIGIVTMQLLVLKLNTGIGHALAQQSRLQRENAAMSIENSTAASGENIEPEANRKGMQVAPVGAIGFVTVTKADIARAAAALRNAAPVSSETKTASSSSEPSTESAESSEGTSTQAATAETPPPSTTQTPSTGETSASSQAPTAESESAATPSQTTSTAAVPSGESPPGQPASASGGTAPPSQG